MLFYLTFFLFSVQVGAFPLLARQSSSVTTVQTINSPSGPVTQSCVTVLTPITDDQGNDAVQAVKTCTLLAASSVVSGASSSSTSTSPPSSSIEPSNASSTVPTPTPLSSSLPSPAPTSPSSTPTSATESTAAAEQASTTSNAAFTLPGKKLSVLPIGLGVFGGISAIALIVVGLVTYERTKYRKAFRQRKLAETGAAMGYGGNAAL